MIKVEAPEGDSSRYTGVPRHRGMSGSFQHNARGKRSIAMDLKQPAAREALLRLVPTVDAFASNIRPRRSPARASTTRRCEQAQPVDRLSQHGRLRQRRPLCRTPGLRRPDPGGVRHSDAAATLHRPAALHPDGGDRPHRRFGGGQRIARRPAGTRPHRHRPAHRGADVRDHGAVRAVRAHAGPHLRSAHQPRRLCTHAVAASPPVPDQGRLHRRAALQRRPVAPLLRGHRQVAYRGDRSALRRHRRAHGQHRCALRR